MSIKNIWSYVGMVIVLVGVALGVGVILAPKKVDGYYLSTGGNGGGANVICVYAHWTWHNDERAFCTDRYQDALDFATKANANLK